MSSYCKAPNTSNVLETSHCFCAVQKQRHQDETMQCLKVVQLLSRVWFLCNPVDCSLPGFSVGFPRQEYWSGLTFLSPGGLPDPGINLHVLHQQEDSFSLSHLENLLCTLVFIKYQISVSSFHFSRMGKENTFFKMNDKLQSVVIGCHTSCLDSNPDSLCTCAILGKGLKTTLCFVFLICEITQIEFSKQSLL